LSKRAEEQLEQERRDAEMARRLQQQLDMEQPETEEARRVFGGIYTQHDFCTALCFTYKAMRPKLGKILVFEKSANFFDENWRKSQKICLKHRPPGCHEFDWQKWTMF
jgi:hypothetical protein